MELSDQVCTFEQAVELPQIGESLFVWVKKNPDSEPGLMAREDWFISRENCRRFSWDAWSAYTVAELGVLLPYLVIVDESGAELELNFFKGPGNSDFWFVEITIDGDRVGVCDDIYDSEAAVKAEALLFLLKNDYIKPDDLKL